MSNGSPSKNNRITVLKIAESFLQGNLSSLLTSLSIDVDSNAGTSVVSSNVPVAVDHAAVATTEAYTAPISTLIPATLNQIDSASTSRPEISSTDMSLNTPISSSLIPSVREQEPTSIATQAAPVTSSLSVQAPTPPSPSANADERTDLSHSHPLVQAHYVIINDGHFSQVRGHQHSHFVTDVNQSMRVPGNSDFLSGSPPSIEIDHTNPAPSFGQSSRLSHASNQLQQSQEISFQKSNDIYERHLTPKGRGFPLWIPEPNRVLPMNYRRTGIRIGDVGIITHSGGFSFLFNICLPRDDPVNPRMLPEHFAPISPPIEAIDIDEFFFFQNGSHLASGASIRTQTSNDISGIVFESSASEGAILTMPRGARSEDLGNYARFREYAAANVADWYRFVNGPRGREAKNGDVRLVVGFDKTTSWGIATFANQTQQNSCHLRFGPSQEAGLMSSAHTYTWQYSGAAEVQVGPSLNQIDELRRDGDPSGVQFENQCLFVRTLNTTLSDGDWVNIHSGLGSVHVNPQNSPHHDSDSNNSVAGSSSNLFSSHGVQSGTQRTAGSHHGLQDIHLLSDNNLAMFIPGPFKSLTDHPSKALNDILLAKVPAAKMVITHDNDWSSVITQYDIMPDPSAVVEDILACHDICEENGVIFLQPALNIKTSVPEMLIAVMGATGTGKSTLIHTLTGDENIHIGHGQESETDQVQLSTYFDPANNCNVTLVDTPGFDDSRDGVTDTDILRMIIDFLQYRGGQKLNGLIYMHRISDPRMGAISKRNLRMFRQLCGDGTLKNVCIATTNWDRVSKEEGEKRERELREGPNLFQPLIKEGAQLARHDKGITSARSIIDYLIHKDPTKFQIQVELDEGKTLGETEAGSVLMEEIKALKAKQEAELQALKEKMEEAAREKHAKLLAELEKERQKGVAQRKKMEEDLEYLKKKAQSDKMESEAKIRSLEERMKPGQTQQAKQEPKSGGGCTIF